MYCDSLIIYQSMDNHIVKTVLIYGIYGFTDITDIMD